MKNLQGAVAVAVALIIPALAAGQLPVPAAAAASSVASTTDVPGRSAAPDPAGYRSAFEGYRRYAEQPVGSWRQANEVVGAIGGWQAYAREAQAPAGSPASAPAQADRPAARASAPGPASAAASAPAQHGSHRH